MTSLIWAIFYAMLMLLELVKYFRPSNARHARTDRAVRAACESSDPLTPRCQVHRQAVGRLATWRQGRTIAQSRRPSLSATDLIWTYRSISGREARVIQMPAIGFSLVVFGHEIMRCDMLCRSRNAV